MLGNDNEAAKKLSFALEGSAISAEKTEIIKALLFGNVSLIKSIPNEYFGIPYGQKLINKKRG